MLSTVHERARDTIVSIAFVAVVSAGMPIIQVHAHDDAAFGHGHDVHVHSHDDGDTGDPDGSREPLSPDEEGPHAHILGSIAVAVTPPMNVDISIPVHGPGRIPPPVRRPPEKPVPPLYRPPIA